MREVTKNEFFAKMNCNVHPSIKGPYDMAKGYTSYWTMQDGSSKVIGMSYGGTHLMEHKYFLAD